MNSILPLAISCNESMPKDLIVEKQNKTEFTENPVGDVPFAW